MNKKPHLVISGFTNSEKFKSKRLGRSQGIPSRDRVQHGNKLLNEYNQVVQFYLSKQSQTPKSITEQYGIYIEITSAAKSFLPLEKIDNRDFILCSLKSEGEYEVAVLFIPDKKRNAFVKKIEDYLSPNKDFQKGPRNQALINVIETIKIANLHSFWTDDPSKFPQDINQEDWFELWLSNNRDGAQDPIAVANLLAQHLNAKVSNVSLTFYQDVVILIKTSLLKLEGALELIANLSELRKAKEISELMVTLNPKGQTEWAESIVSQVSIEENISTTICILDNGINYNNPLLAVACGKDKCVTWEQGWPVFDNFNPSGSFNDHGSRQAGLAIYGRLEKLIESREKLLLKHDIESARILPPASGNEPELYGAITKGAISKLEIARTVQNRIHSLSITAAPEFPSGQPSSWSSEIDYYSSGFEDGKQRLFLISAGNNINLKAKIDYWDQVHLAEIEDPAQAWNSITIGAYTEESTNTDPNLINWSPLALPGDISPGSTTSVCWGWKKQAPFKPDLVAEGGNRLLSPSREEITNADTVSLLTTSGRADGNIFETTGDTSSATAIISHQAAIIWAQYPNLWPETIRGLLIHSARWTPRMYERLGSLESLHSEKVAREIMLRTFGYGVPNVERALYSANNLLTLVAQDFIQPFYKNESDPVSIDPKLHEMNLYELPWPKEMLLSLGEMEVNLRVVLSYFIEPNSGRRGYRQRYSYQSHGLRFDVIRPEQSIGNFRGLINKIAEDEDYEGPQGNTEGWHLGARLRTRGSLHSDFWTGTAAELSAMGVIAVYPVSGWWKYRTGQERCNTQVRYSLIVSIEVPDESVDIYSIVDNIIKAKIPIKV